MSAEQGSLWHRWDPHVHTPGTILADQYPADDGWEQFLARVEAADPPVRALGITDYYSTATYQEARAHKAGGRLPSVELLFPNVELRLGVGTHAGSPINIHLLVSPENTDHLERLHSFLANLEFEALGERYRCTPADIMRLGRAHEPTVLTDRRALEVGTNQFKVDLADLRAAMRASVWAQTNILIAVAASSNDGTAGLQGDASLARLRREIERAAHIIFSGKPNDRTFWLGRNPAMPKAMLIAEYSGPKPCLHGSDAHRPDRVAAPDRERRCWLKGALAFETLRQACLEPETRVFVGAAVPPGPPPSQVISEVSLSNATFLLNSTLPLNPGLVAIIGARGSGKTALADFIAVGAGVLSPASNRQSFVYRAGDHLRGARVDLSWGDGSECGTALAGLDEAELATDNIYVRYLSQQFVDRLCSAEGLTDELLQEIQRVIFLAHPTEERMGTTDFAELLEMRTETSRLSRAQHEEILRELSDEFVAEREKAASAGPLRMRLAAIEAQIKKAQGDRVALVGKSGGSQERLDAYAIVAQALQARRSEQEQLDRRKAALQNLANEVSMARTRAFPDALRQLRLRNQAAQLPEVLWPRFAYAFSGDVDGAIAAEQAEVTRVLAALAGPPQAPPSTPPAASSLLPIGADLPTMPISLLQAEAARLEGLIGVDRAFSKALLLLNSKIAGDEGLASSLRQQIALAEAAPARIEAIKVERREAYASVFAAVIAHQAELSALYAPLAARIASEQGSARKLSFEVRRRVDRAAWGERGEELLDLRKGSKLRRGSLAEIAKTILAPAWTNGSAADVTAALSTFREHYDAALAECCPHNIRDPACAAEVRKWAGDVSAWLYSTDHIAIAYGVQYDGTDVERLSPGTRGIVLLLLYLAIDVDDDRPLLIDQPEENLDPRSIFVELVDRFRTAKQRRQIIIVTHNANLVVNTDADQVIVASCGSHRPGELPEISYLCGGLEDAVIRAKVCDFLEGGEEAFKERAKRLRVNL